MDTSETGHGLSLSQYLPELENVYDWLLVLIALDQCEHGFQGDWLSLRNLPNPEIIGVSA